VALYYARQGATGEAEACLERAASVLAEAKDWRRDRIGAKILATRTYLGSAQAGAEEEIAPAEWGPVILARAMACPDDAFQETVAALARLASNENFDVLKAALRAYAELFNRFYTVPERRAQTEKAIKVNWGAMPVFVRIDLLNELVDASLAHGDRTKALQLVDEAKALMDAARWQPRFAFGLMAASAQRRFRAGDAAGALAEAQAALRLFDAKRETIADIYRAQMLRPIAEAFHVMGDGKMALHLYQRAVEAGMENPNSRPRADDLVATCCSMATHAVEPDAVLASRIREICNGLGDPW
jgi:hypothetical protein